MASRFSLPPYMFGIHSPGFARVIQIQHRCDGVHAQPVDVVLLQPEHRVRDQEGADLVAAVVEDQRAPIAMLALARIGVLVQGGAVEECQAVRVLGKCAGTQSTITPMPFWWH